MPNRKPKKNFLFTDEDVIPALDELVEHVDPLEALEASKSPKPPNAPPPKPGDFGYGNDKHRDDPLPYEPGPTRRPDEDDPLVPPHEHPAPPSPDHHPGAGNPEEFDPIARQNDLRRQLYDQQRGPDPTDPRSLPAQEPPRGNPVLGAADSPEEDTTLGPAVHFGEIMPPAVHHYEGRVRIVDAWQYPGSLRGAPDYVDRNWAAYGDWDPLRNIEPGPALRVPFASASGYVMCRIGDYVARQETRILSDVPGEISVEVWERGQFERLFIPVIDAPTRVAA